MLCNPIFDIQGEVMGVAQVINKKGTPTFTANDEHVFQQYLQFCGIGLRNARLYERSQLENKRNQVLLDLARMVFEKQSNIENIMYRILLHIQSLLQCSRY
jgi:dual 3',5'-cyclic-AMP and -GMP phosphodiesterase 11